MLWEWLNQNLENCRSILSTNISAAHFLKSSNLHFDIYKINSSLESPLYSSGCNTQPKIKKKFFCERHKSIMNKNGKYVYYYFNNIW